MFLNSAGFVLLWEVIKRLDSSALLRRDVFGLEGFHWTAARLWVSDISLSVLIRVDHADWFDLNSSETLWRFSVFLNRIQIKTRSEHHVRLKVLRGLFWRDTTRLSPCPHCPTILCASLGCLNLKTGLNQEINNVFMNSIMTRKWPLWCHRGQRPWLVWFLRHVSFVSAACLWIMEIFVSSWKTDAEDLNLVTWESNRVQVQRSDASRKTCWRS